MNELLDVNEAAKFLHISPYTLRGWVSQRNITYVKLGRRAFYRLADLDKKINVSLVEEKREINKSA
jgi:excisionase family DNA binding protein